MLWCFFPNTSYSGAYTGFHTYWYVPRSARGVIAPDRVFSRPLIQVLSGFVGTGVHLPCMKDNARNLGLRAHRRDEPDVERLVELVLNIAEARHQAYIEGEPDPYGLPVPISRVEAHTRSPGAKRHPHEDTPAGPRPQNTRTPGAEDES